MHFPCPYCGRRIERLPVPVCTVDAIVELRPGCVLLVRRRFEPLGWALPGGIVEAGESLEEACRRETLEETSVEILELRQMHTYSDPSRDARHPTVSTVFVARGSGTPVAGDDAAEAVVFPIDRLPQPLCFDHDAILADYRQGRWGLGPGGFPVIPHKNF
jgi:8-oxo-dGTP diphosphatase